MNFGQCAIFMNDIQRRAATSPIVRVRVEARAGGHNCAVSRKVAVFFVGL